MKNESKKNLPHLDNGQENDPILQFEYISDAVDLIDKIVEAADHCKNRKEKKEKLEQADKLARAYEKHCGRPNQFKNFL